ncbi:MAG: hypothetical protein KBG15_17455 [Kofleriaceae bacterium]|nr:hypothetical protein [Kofleriaceae bacterium]
MAVSHEIDEATLRSMQQGDVAALRALLLMYQDRVVALCYGIAGHGDAAAAQAVALDVFLLVFANLKKLPGLGPARLSPWILTIAAQRAVAVQRAQVASATSHVQSDAAAAEHAALLLLPPHSLAARAWGAHRATPEFADNVIAAVVRVAAGPAEATPVTSTVVGMFASASARRVSVIVAAAAVAAFAIATLRWGGEPPQRRPTLAELQARGSAVQQLPLPCAGSGTAIVARSALASMSAHEQAQREEIAALKAQVVALQAELDSSKSVDEDTGYPHPRPEVLQRWAAECHTRFDNLDVSQESPLQVTSDTFGLTSSEVPGFNAALREVHANWLVVVRAAYLEITGDAVGVKVLSPTAMISEMNNKGAKNEINALRTRIANERAGLVPTPAADAAMSALERHYRAYANLGDTIETAVAKRIGAERARAVRGNGWNHQTEATGCAP